MQYTRAQCLRTVPVCGKQGPAREFAPGGIPRELAGATEAAGEPGLAPAQWGCVSEFPGPRGCLGAAVGRSLLSHLSQNLVSPHVSRCEPPFGPVNSVAKLPKGPLKVLCPSSPADKAKVLRNYRWFTQKKISFL